MEAITKLMELKNKEKRLEDQLAECKEDIKETEREVFRFFRDNGVGHININGHTVYLSHFTTIHKKAGVESGEVIQVLRSMGLNDFVKDEPVHASVRAYYRELKKEEKEIPAALLEVYQPYEEYQVKIRKGE